MSRRKVKLSDRFLALLLSVLMIFAMIPVTTLQSLAETEEYPNYYTVTVTEENGAVIAGANINLYAEIPETDVILDLSAQTDNNGTAAIDNAEIAEVLTNANTDSASVKLTVSKDGYETKETDTVVKAAEACHCDIILTPKVEIQQATVSVTVTGDATVELNGATQNTATVAIGTEVPVKIIPVKGSYIKNLMVGGESVSVTKWEAYEGVIKADADVAVSATVVKEVTVTASGVTGGTITLNGDKIDTLTVDENTKVTVGVAAEEGYHISSVAIGGKAQELKEDTSFAKEITVTEDTEIAVTFAKVYTITVTHNNNGTVVTNQDADGGSVTVVKDSKVVLTAEPDDNYRISEVKINDSIDEEITGENFGPEDKYVKELIADKDYTVVITFAPNRYKVTSAPTENGSITIASDLVDYDGSSAIIITPENGYAVKSVKVNGKDIDKYEVENQLVKFTITNITEAKAIEADFVPVEKANVNIKDLFNDEEALCSDEMTFVYAKDKAAVFSTDKDGIILYNKNGQVIGGGKGFKTVIISGNTEIAKIELLYQAASNMAVMPHEVTGVSSDLPLKIAIDNTKTKSVLIPDEPNVSGFYNNNFNVKLNIEEQGDSTGISSVEYFVTSKGVTGTYDEIQESDKTEFGTVYTFNGLIENVKTIIIPVTAAKNDSDKVAVWVKVTDRAGNVETLKTEEMKVCVTAPKLISVEVSGTKADDAVSGYFNSKRTATVVIEDRASAFDETVATNGIEITAKDFDGNAQVISKPSMISWAHSGDRHVATIVFSGEANYTWAFKYTNKADLELDKTGVVETGENIYEFTVDTKAPVEQVISIDAENKWEEVLSELVFKVWKNYDITVTATAIDKTSGVKEIAYYKINEETVLTEEELEILYRKGKEFVETPYTVGNDEKFIVYARISDKAGNYCYISTNGLIYDGSKSVISLNPEPANENGFYNKDVKININIDEILEGKEAYSGIKTIDYKVVKDGDLDNPTQSANLYKFDNENPKYAELKSFWTGDITVKAALNNSDNVKVFVTVVDNAGNEETAELALAINIDVIKATITLDGKANKIVDGRGYYSMSERVATIVITDRASAFDETAATEGIVVKNDKGKIVTSGYTIEKWDHDGNLHMTKITFSENENYVWEYSYTNLAGNSLDIDKNLDTGDSETPFVFTVDDEEPTGTITVHKKTWNELLEKLTFGIFSKDLIEVRAKADVKTSPVKLEYYKVTNDEAPIIMSEDVLNKLYEEGKFEPYTDFDVTSDEQFVVYLKITDYAGNYTYINSDGAIVDKVPCEVKIIREKGNVNDLYGLDYKDGIKVDMNVTDVKPYSGIKTIDYKVIKDNDWAKPTDSGFYSFEKQNPAQTDLVENWAKSITIKPEENNSCKVIVAVTVVDNAGNTSTSSESFDIDVTKPEIDISFNDIKENKVVKGRGYFAGKRVATVVIKERTHHFDATDATKGIVINATDAKGNPVSDAYTISPWTTTEGAKADDATHTATITFKKDANYTWSVSYKDKAGNPNMTPNTGTSITPFTFTVDTKAPTGTIKATTAEGREVVWEKLRGTLTFGIWSKEHIGITGTARDETSVAVDKVEYYKVTATSATDGTKALTKTQLDEVTSWKPFTNLKVKKDEQFVVYVKITDPAGNYTYISTNGLIIDRQAPLAESVAPEVSVEPKQPVNGLYKGDVKVDIKVTDPMTGGTYSGLKKIWYEVKNMGEITQGGQDKPLYEFQKTNPKQKELCQTWTGSIMIDSTLNNSNDVEVIVYAQDNSLNGSDKTVALKIDITKPTILVSYDNNIADSESFFKEDRTATVVVTERNFDPKDVMIDITNTDGVIPAISGFSKTKEGTGNMDDTQWTATIKYTVDGDYTFDVEYTDLANNICDDVTFASGTICSKEFTIDHTLPVIDVTYDNNASLNGNYYKEARTATIIITEHNFSADRVTVTQTATDDGAERTTPAISGWRSEGDRHTATINYSTDGKYSFDISVDDKAGNSSEDYTEDMFIVDTTMPTLTISGITDKSANSGDVIPVITYSDTNYIAEQVTISLTGANRKQVEIQGKYTNEHNGRTFTFDNFEKNKEIDDIYTLTASLTDKAGNMTTETINFSVNRFGSTYGISEATEKLNGTYVKKPIDVVVTETNTNELKNIKITLFKNNETLVLKEGEDYKIKVEGGNGTWYHYTYTVDAKNFTEDGVYGLTFHSEDEAGNVAENTLDTKEKEIRFGVDATKPNIIVANLENGITYDLENMTVDMFISDNLLLSSIIVYLDDYTKPYKTWTAEEIATIVAENERFTFDISGDSKSAHKVKVVAIDTAGNEHYEEIVDFFITTDVWVRYYNNKPVFWGTIAGVVILIGVIVFSVVYKRKKKINN